MSDVFNPPGIYKLPVEIIDHIASDLEDDIASLCCFSLASKNSLTIARRRLFYAVKVRPRRSRSSRERNNPWKKSLASTPSRDPTFLLDFLRFLQENPSVAQRIHRIKILGETRRVKPAPEEKIYLFQLDFIMAKCKSLQALYLGFLRIALNPTHPTASDSRLISELSTLRPASGWPIKTLQLDQLLTKAGSDKIGFSNYLYVLSSFKTIDGLILSPATTETRSARNIYNNVVEAALPKNLEVRALYMRGCLTARPLYEALGRANVLRSVRLLRISVMGVSEDVDSFQRMTRNLIPACCTLDKLTLDLRNEPVVRSADDNRISLIVQRILPRLTAETPATTIYLQFNSVHSDSSHCLCLLQRCLKHLPNTIRTIYIELLVMGDKGKQDAQHLKGMNWGAIRQKLSSFKQLRRIHFSLACGSLAPNPYRSVWLTDASDNSDTSSQITAPSDDIPPAPEHRDAIKNTIIGGLTPLRDGISVTASCTTQRGDIEEIPNHQEFEDGDDAIHPLHTVAPRS